jgi:hypothetical protein
MQVMSSMRIADNLEESVSTFYAELKKLQGIIQAVNQKSELNLCPVELTAPEAISRPIFLPFQSLFFRIH